MPATGPYIEIEIKLCMNADPESVRQMLEQHGYHVADPRELESDQLFDRAGGELRNSDQLLRLRRTGSRATATYKGPALRRRHKGREEIEFEVSSAEAFTAVLDRLGYMPSFRYEKYRTKFAAAGEPGFVTLDETPIGVFLELEGPAEWIDRTAAQIGFPPGAYLTSSYAALYRDYRRSNPASPENMVFERDSST